MPKITSEVSQQLLNEIKKIQVNGDFHSRGAVVEYLVNLAIKHMDQPVGDFGDQDGEECFLKISAEDYDLTRDYRARFLLTKKRHFLNHALRHGVTIHNAGVSPSDGEKTPSPPTGTPKKSKK
jgi:hypothetical protein